MTPSELRRLKMLEIRIAQASAERDCAEMAAIAERLTPEQRAQLRDRLRAEGFDDYAEEL